MNYVVKQEGLGPVGILWLLFIALKVIAVIDWSWLVVIFWPVGVWALFIVVFAFCYAVGHIVSEGKRAKMW